VKILKRLFRKRAKPKKVDDPKPLHIEVDMEKYLPDCTTLEAIIYLTYKDVEKVEFDPSNPTGIPTKILYDFYI